MSKTTDSSMAWMGWVSFAGIMLLLGGFFSLLAGFVALFKDGVVFSNFTNSVWILTYSQWGWIHMIIGLLAIIAAGSLMAGNMYGRVVAVIVAFASALVNMAFLPMYPFWSIIIITIDIMVIYSVMAHGGELKDLSK